MDAKPSPQTDGPSPRRSVWQVFAVFLGLGLTSFGGPIAHLGYFREAFVSRLKWLDERAYAELVALCQILPGPASSQVGFAIGLTQAGYGGAMAAFIGFTLPSSLLMFGAAWGLGYLPADIRAPLFHGLVLVAAPVVAHAVIGMAMRLCNQPLTAAIGVVTAAVLIAFDQTWLPPALILAGGLAGMAFLTSTAPQGAMVRAPVTKSAGIACLAAFAILLVGLPVLSALIPSAALAVTDGFFRTGALVFGGGHVILPLLESETVERGWLGAEPFLAGYGAAQALPGPLTAFAAYLGAASDTGLPGIAAGLIALAAIFAPGFLLVAGVMPFWNGLSGQRWMPGLAAGAGAAVVGVLAAALWRPVISSAILSPLDAAIAAAGLLALMLRAPVWLVVLGVALAGAYSSAG
jgi:chromate transporter